LARQAHPALVPLARGQRFTCSACGSGGGAAAAEGRIERVDPAEAVGTEWRQVESGRAISLNPAVGW